MEGVALMLHVIYKAMIGDLKIYINDHDDMELAEIEIMIAEQKRYFFLLAQTAGVLPIH
jgi:hypothetical protein